MKWALVDKDNIVKHLIVYDGVAEYKPADGLSLIEVNDWIDKEDHKDKLKPIDKIPDPIEEKKTRDDLYKKDLAVVALYEIEKKSNPNLIFSDYLDNLEDQVKSPKESLDVWFRAVKEGKWLVKGSVG